MTPDIAEECSSRPEPTATARDEARTSAEADERQDEHEDLPSEEPAPEESGYGYGV